MDDARKALAVALAEQSGGDDDLRDWLTDRAEFVADALWCEGYSIVPDGYARIDGQVVALVEVGWEWDDYDRARLGRRVSEDLPDDPADTPLYMAHPL